MSTIIKHEAIIKNLTTAAERAYRRGIQTGSGGNLSMRIEGEELMIISASGGSFIDCETSGSGWVITDFDAVKKDKNAASPSKESILHGYLYKQFANVKSIVHCHSPWVITWANIADELPLVSWQATLKLKSPVPVFSQKQPAVSANECEIICDSLKRMSDFTCFILREHGLIATGNSAIEAEHQAEFLEECAQIAVLKTLSGAPLFTGKA